MKRFEGVDLVRRSAADPRGARAWLDLSQPKEAENGLSAMRQFLGNNVTAYLAQLTEADLRGLEAGVDAMNRLMALAPPTD